MRKETIITAVIFLAVGFLAGYITDAQINWNSRQKAASVPSEMPPPAGASAASAPAGGAATPAGLPEGHPPIDSATVAKQMEAMAAQDPKNPEIPLRFANFLYDQKQYDKAIEWYQRALALDPKNVNAHTDLGTAYFYTGKPQEALKEYQKSLAIDPQHEQTLLNTIVVNLQGTHDPAGAQAAWDRLNKVNPNQPALANLQAQITAARAASKTGQ